MTLEYSGTLALILGGSCELALQLARAMIGDSLRPILTYRNEAGRDRIVRGLEDLPGRYESRRMDLADRTTLEALLDSWGEAPLDFTVDFAHGDYEELVAAADDDIVEHYFRENVSSRACFLKRAARIMLRRRKGRMVFVSSGAAENPNRGQGFYAASKLACEALYRSVGLELARRGVTTVILRPGYVRAGRGRAYLEREGKQVSRKIPTGKALEGEEVARTILFLLSNHARNLNATVVTMDGGLSSGK